MKKKLFFYFFIYFLIFAEGLCAQAVAKVVTAGPYIFRSVSSFETPNGFVMLKPLVFSEGILQLSLNRPNNYHFQWFSNDMEMLKENTIDLNTSFSTNTWSSGFLKLKTKLYLLGCELYSERGSMGMSAIAIDPKALDVKGTVKHLYESSGKVNAINLGNKDLGYGLNISDDKTKFMCSYNLEPMEKRDNINKNVIGIHVFDENLTKLWGNEIEMPYTEAKMENLSCTVTNDGKVCLLVKVYDGEGWKGEVKDMARPNYHFEVIVYKKGSNTPKVIEIKLDNYFNRGIYMHQDKAGNMAIAGFYGKKATEGIDGSYLFTLDIDMGAISKINGGFFEISSDFIKSMMSDKQRIKAERKAEKNSDFDLKLNLLLSDIYSAVDGSTKIISEIFWSEGHSTVASTSNGMTTSSIVYHCDDIIIINIKDGKMEWIKKIPKMTVSKEFGSMSINSVLIGNDLHVFWKDNPENSNFTEGQTPSKYTGRNGILRGCTVSANGDIQKYDIVNLKGCKIQCNLKEFLNNGNNSLSNNERVKKRNAMFTLDIK